MEKKELNDVIAVDFIHAIKKNNWDFLKRTLEECQMRLTQELNTAFRQ